jgi:hypothetical protein
MGPTLQDRLVGLNLIATKTTVVLVLLAVLWDQKIFLDVALVYAILGYVGNHRNHQIFEKRNPMISNIFMGVGLFFMLIGNHRCFEVSGCLYAPPCQFKVWNHRGNLHFSRSTRV